MGNTTTIQLVSQLSICQKMLSASERSDSISSTSTSKLICRTVFSSKVLQDEHLFGGLGQDGHFLDLCIRETLMAGFRIGGYLVLQLNHSHTSLLHFDLSLSTFCLITTIFVFTSSNGPNGALTTCAAFWSVRSESSTQLRKLIGRGPRFPPWSLKSRPSCLPLFALKHGLSTRHAVLDLTCGLV